ncbi:MAG: CoA-binding protein [Minisyncoccia bacterium]
MSFLFNPRKICVVGASANRKKVGFAIFNNILKNGFRGKVFPVNWKEKFVLGRKCYSNVSAIPEDLDLAIIAIPASNVLPVVEECGQKGIKNIVIISAGFKEIGSSGKYLEDELKKLAESPNSFANHLKMKYPQLGYEEDENAEEVEQYMTNLGIEGYLEDALRNVKAALLRIKNNKYGLCQLCGEKIDKARLMAYPAATLCWSCQKRKDPRY